MVKANAYGHGDVIISKALESFGAKSLGVGLIEEGVLLREANLKTDIYFYGTFNLSDVEAIIEYRLTPVLSLWSQIEYLESFLGSQASFTAPLKVHIKFDTGMHRLGFCPEDVDKLNDYFEKSKLLILDGLLTHLHSAEDLHLSEGSSENQIQLFETICNQFSNKNLKIHSLNSQGIFHSYIYPQRQFLRSYKQGARPGLLLYGSKTINQKEEFKQVMSLKTKIVRYVKVPKDEGVSYSWTWRSKRESVIGILPMGYADGYRRLLSNKAQALVCGQRVSVVGNVCMDYFMIDVTDLIQNGNIKMHQPVDVTIMGYDGLGNFISAEDLAQNAKTISYEIFTSISERVFREVVTSDPSGLFS